MKTYFGWSDWHGYKAVAVKNSRGRVLSVHAFVLDRGLRGLCGEFVGWGPGSSPQERLATAYVILLDLFGGDLIETELVVTKFALRVVAALPNVWRLSADRVGDLVGKLPNRDGSIQRTLAGSVGGGNPLAGGTDDALGHKYRNLAATNGVPVV